MHLLSNRRVNLAELRLVMRKGAFGIVAQTIFEILAHTSLREVRRTFQFVFIMCERAIGATTALALLIELAHLRLLHETSGCLATVSRFVSSFR